MTVKPLTAPQKKVLKSLARSLVAADLSNKVDGMEGFLNAVHKNDKEAVQADRAFRKIMQQTYADYAEAFKNNGA